MSFVFQSRLQREQHQQTLCWMLNQMVLQLPLISFSLWFILPQPDSWYLYWIQKNKDWKDYLNNWNQTKSNLHCWTCPRNTMTNHAITIFKQLVTSVEYHTSSTIYYLRPSEWYSCQIQHTSPLLFVSKDCGYLSSIT